MQLPELIRIRQSFPANRIEDIRGAVRRELDDCGIAVQPGMRIAIAVGSRGIANIALVVREVVRWLKDHGADPFIVPAMGSHGGATPEGQQAIIEGYGVTEAYVGAPIRSSMQVVELPQGAAEVPVYCDKWAAEADGTIVINRIKPHTDFHGTYESGLMKMMVIGLGKHVQAMTVHRLGVYGLREVIPQVARQVLAHGNILLGLGIVENAYDETMALRAIPAQEIPQAELELLDLARTSMPRLPVDALDILVVDQIGKDISGAGLDTNIIGRMYIRGVPEPAAPDIAQIIIRDLTEASHGNAAGMGLADIMTRQLFDKIDIAVTNENVYTSSFLLRGKFPMLAETDRQALQYAWRSCGSPAADTLRLIRIRSTLHLQDLLVSPAVLAEIEGRAGIEIIGPAGKMVDGFGAMPPFDAAAR